MTFIPRIKGRVGQATEPEEYKGKWFFEITLSHISGHESKALGEFVPYETEKEAQEKLEEAVQLASESIQTHMVGAPTGEYLDMKDLETKKWKPKK